MTETLFQAQHISHLHFSDSRHASNSKNCSIRETRPRAFQKAFYMYHQISTFGSKIFKIVLLGICIVTQCGDFNYGGLILVNLAGGEAVCV